MPWFILLLLLLTGLGFIGVCVMIAHMYLTEILAAIRTWQRSRTGRCPQCGYDLTGNTSGICPECGSPVPHGASASSRDQLH